MLMFEYFEKQFRLTSQTCPLNVFMHLQHSNDVFKVQC
jgi:hypothetical protein